MHAIAAALCWDVHPSVFPTHPALPCRAPPGRCAAATTTPMMRGRPPWLRQCGRAMCPICAPRRGTRCGATRCRLVQRWCWVQAPIPDAAISLRQRATFAAAAAAAKATRLLDPLTLPPPCKQELRVLAGEREAWRLSVRGGGGHDLLTISPVGGPPACLHACLFACFPLPIHL